MGVIKKCKRLLGWAQKSERQGAEGSLRDSIHFLHVVTPSRMWEVIVYCIKIQVKVEQHEERGICPRWKNKIKPNETEVNNLPDKELKVIVIKMLTELGRIMDEHEENSNKDGKYKKVLNRSHRAEEYNSWIEKYIRKFQQHTGWNRRKDQSTWRLLKSTHQSSKRF